MKVWENLIQLFSQMNTANIIFETALQKINDYLENPSDDTQMQAKAVCTDAANILLKLPGTKANLKEEDFQYFYEKKIDAADYCAPFDTFRPNLRSNVDSLLNMRTYLSQQPQTEKELRQMHQMNCQSHLLCRQIDYLGLNHFVVESKLTKAETAKFQDMLATLSSFSQVAVWETDLSILNAKIEKTFQDYENLVSQYAKSVGEYYSDYLKEKEFEEKKLSSLGCDHKTFEKIVDKIEHSSQMAGTITKLERAELWKKANSST